MMKVSGFCALFLFLVVVTALTFFNFSSPTGTASCFPDLVATRCGYKTTLIAVSRKLKENGNNKGDIGRVTLDDYHDNIDPQPRPSSWIDVRDKPPTEHGTPLNPFIPKPPPPSPPNY